MLKKKEMLLTVCSQLAFDLNCDPGDLMREGVTFCQAIAGKGIWLDERQIPHLKVLTMGKGIVVCADAYILEIVKPILENQFRDDLFSAPFLFGHSLYYIPDAVMLLEQPCPAGISLTWQEGNAIYDLYANPGFENALRYDRQHPRPDALALCAVNKRGEIIGVAGASADNKVIWQIGIDINKEYRGLGLASCLVTRLANRLMERGIVPFYGTASSNIASQAVAHRSGFKPAWMCNYKHTLDEQSPFQKKARVMIQGKEEGS